MNNIDWGLLITIIALIVGVISLYYQYHDKKRQLKFEKSIIKNLRSQNRILKKALKEMKANRQPLEWEKQIAEKELQLKQQRENRLGFQTGFKLLKSFFK